MKNRFLARLLGGLCAAFFSLAISAQPTPDYQRRHAGTASGTNTYTATLVNAPASYVTGQIYIVQFTNANTGAATLNANSLGAKAIQKNGSALTGGEIAAGQTVALEYDGTNLQLVGVTGTPSTGTVTTTGSPSSGNLTKFSGSTSITNADLTGDCTTSGGVATTCTKINGTTPGGTCTNQFVTSISSSAVPTCTTDTLASAQHANQGTTTTVLHGNASGNPSFGSVANADMATMSSHTIKANITGSSAVPVDSSLNTILDTEVGSSQGRVLCRNGTNWVSANGSNSSSTYLDGTCAFTTPAATGGAGWVTALDCDLTAQSTQTLSSDTTYTFCGLTWTKINSTNDRVAMALTNGTGLAITPKTTGTYNATPTRTMPAVYTDLATIVPQFYLGAPVRIWYYMSADTIASSGDFSGVSIDNLAASSTTIVLGITSRANSGGTRIIQYAGTTGTSSLTSLNATSNTDRVVVIQFPTGPIGSGTVFSGSYSSGWPAVTAIRPVVFQTTASQAFTNAQDFVTGLPMKMVIFGQCTAGTPSYTYARIRVDYRVQ